MEITRQPRPLSTWHRPSEKKQWCGDCRRQMPFEGRACFDCATQMKALDDAQTMPRTFLEAHSSNFVMHHLFSTSRLEFAPPLREGERRLGWFTLPPFQRGAVWTQEQQIRFIESVWLGLPIGSYAYNDAATFKGPTTNWLIDGQQRVTTVLTYVAGEIEVFGKRFPELHIIEKRQFENTPFPAIVTRSDDEAYLAEIYDRLAYGGTAHEPKS